MLEQRLVCYHVFHVEYRDATIDKYYKNPTYDLGLDRLEHWILLN
jgi:hypothetical protein